MRNEDKIDVSVIIVARNEEEYIINCIKSIEKQFSRDDNWELILVDGLSEDRTKEKALSYLSNKKYKWRILENEKKILSSGWNLGIKEAKGKYVIRPDAHSLLGDNYIKIGMKELQKRESENVVGVGGVLVNKGKGLLGEAIADLFSSRFGVGNSKFRVGVNKPQYTDTIVFGLYRKEIFDKVGLFNEDLIRNQDINLHKRILKKGYKLLTHPDMKIVYFVRNNLVSLVKKAFNDGYWLIYSGFRVRHLIPFLFVLYLVLVIFFLFLGFNCTLTCFIPLYSYLAMSTFFSLRDGKNWLNKFLLMFLYPVFHLSYGVGTLLGLIGILFNINKSNAKEKK